MALENILSRVKSTKIKERTEAVSELRQHLSVKRHVVAVHTVIRQGRDGDSEELCPKRWLAVFQAAFQFVLTERKALTSSKTSSSSAAVSRRLQDGASLVRFLAEVSVKYLTMKVIIPLCEHLLQTMVHKNKLLSPVALDYIKTLGVLFSYSSHVDHLHDETWFSIVQLGFNVILEDPLNMSLEDEPSVDSDASDFYAPDDSSVASGSAAGVSRKRRRRSPTQRGGRTIEVSAEQVEFNRILTALLRSSTAPLVSEDHPHVATSILSRLQRFIDIYPNDSSLHLDYLRSLSSTLSHIALNRKKEVHHFASEVWGNLVHLWQSNKTKRLKEGLASVLRVLFPFFILDPDVGPSNNYSIGISQLWALLDEEADNRGSLDVLDLEKLRLQLKNPNDGETPFVANTFRAGATFDSVQALAWAVLELQADCTEKMFQLSDSVHHTVKVERGGSKRSRVQNPIASTLLSIQADKPRNIRIYHLQILLFFIDRHWIAIHTGLQQDVIAALSQLVSTDDGVIQSWIFLCLAAVAFSASTTTSPVGEKARLSGHQIPESTKDITLWNTIWTHAIRRATVPTICRAACHTAFTLIVCSADPRFASNPLPLSDIRILTEIESFAKDVDVQGPAFLCDSVCIFLNECLRFASQDVRLYRMRFEEKVLSWLTDCWRVDKMDRPITTYTINDPLLLLSGICSFSNHCQLNCPVDIPSCWIVETIDEVNRTADIREFLLSAKVPSFNPLRLQTASESPNTTLRSSGEESEGPSPSYESQRPSDSDLVPSQGKERHVANFIQKSLGTLLSFWEQAVEDKQRPAAERARNDVDFAVIAICFEGLLVLNGIRSNRRVVQCATKLISIIFSQAIHFPWTIGEKSLVLAALEPLVLTGAEIEDHEPWEALVPPDAGTGIRAQVLRSLGGTNTTSEAPNNRSNFQRILWKSADMQDGLDNVLNILRSLLREIAGEKPPNSVFDMDVDDKDGFGRIATLDIKDSHRFVDNFEYKKLARICVNVLTTVPVLQSAVGEATRSRDLIDLVVHAADDREDAFFMLLPCLSDSIQRRILSIGSSEFESILIVFGELCQGYQYTKNEAFYLTMTKFFRSTMHLWTSKPVVNSELGQNVRELITHISDLLTKHRLPHWRIRDRLALFFDTYLSRDPYEVALFNPQLQDTTSQGVNFNSGSFEILSQLGSDEDIRVRFRVAAIHARLFTVARKIGRSATDVYQLVKVSYTTNLDDYEKMTTRILSLANIMILSSSVRRGPYWHLLEAALYSPEYSKHIESVLSGVSDRMGLGKASLLFEIYASQIAFSIRQANEDFLKFSPNVLGYREKGDCAAVNFRAISPSNIAVEGNSAETAGHGLQLFERHCKILQKSIADGIEECFGDIAGIVIAAHFLKDESSEGLDDVLIRKLSLDTSERLEFLLRRNFDSVVTAILRTLDEQDVSPNGNIWHVLDALDDGGVASQAFRCLTQYRSQEDFQTHSPNLPNFSSAVIIRALDWLENRVQEDTAAASYHILQDLFAEIQESPLVNEQYRLINAICLWISIHCDEVKEQAVLYALLHGATALLLQWDLVHAAQSLLQWGFEEYLKAERRDPRFPDILVRVCCVAGDFTSANRPPNIQSIGARLRDWTDTLASQLSQSSALESQLLEALPAWPHEPSPALQELFDRIDIHDVSKSLGDSRISSNKFRLVRQLVRHAAAGDYNRDQFRRIDFWRLKGSIPRKDDLQVKDIRNFAELLFLNEGDVGNFTDEQNEETSFSRIRLRRHRKDRAEGENESPQNMIIHSLITIMEGDNMPRARSAYNTLRVAVPVANVDTSDVNAWSLEVRVPLQYFQSFPRKPIERTSTKFDEILVAEPFRPLGDYSIWVSHLCTLISETLSATDALYAQLPEMFHRDESFSEQMLPILTHGILLMEQSRGEDRIRNLLSDYFLYVLNDSTAQTLHYRSVIDIILHLRHSNRSTDPLGHDKWLSVDYLLLARRAVDCGSYTTAVMFLELFHNNTQGEDHVSRHDSFAEDVLYDIYAHIDEPDGFYGIRTQNLSHFLIKRFHHEQQWEKAFRFHGAAKEAKQDDIGATEGLLKSFHFFGFDHLAMNSLNFASSGTASTPELNTLNYKLAWRTETWDLPNPTTSTLDSSLYLALRSMCRDRETLVIEEVIRTAMFEGIDRLRLLSYESIKEIREVTRSLMSLLQMMEWIEVSQNSLMSREEESSNSWNSLTRLSSGFEFTDFEQIMAVRLSLIRSARQKEDRKQIGRLKAPLAETLANVEQTCLITLSEAAREARQGQIALKSTVKAQAIGDKGSCRVSQEFSNVLWHENEQKHAVDALRRTLSTIHVEGESLNETELTERALLFSRLGSWVAEACLEKPADIDKSYFATALNLIHEAITPMSGSNSETHAQIFHRYAIFADRQYQTILKSPDRLRWKVYGDRKEAEIKERSQQMLRYTVGDREYKELNRDQEKAKKLLNEDRLAFESHNSALSTFLELAIDMYSRCLEVADTFDDDTPIRLCSLWFANFDVASIQGKVRTALSRVPSRKLVFVVHQLAARLAKPSQGNEPENQLNLQRTVIRMCKDHPFHSLYPVYCIQSNRIDSGSRRQSERHNPPVAQMERINAAIDIFNQLRGDMETGTRAQNVELLCKASLEWAKYPIKAALESKKGKRGPFEVPKNLELFKIDNIKVPVMTAHTPLDPSMKYENCDWLVSYEKKYLTAGGVNLPKINNCSGTLSNHRQLFKGEGGDDMRQDAVMEQVFELVNNVLRRDRETRRRKLVVRDYRVIPLASQAGVLEFVDNTTVVLTWLTSAHARYYPDDLKHREALDKLARARALKDKSGKIEEIEQECLKTFRDIRTRFHPVMRHWFTEKTKVPMKWFSMRLAYTRSVATSSIVGHILGLGDRHSSNILLDGLTGEAVHIDLGIAFEQGRLLNVPERVPFRLTADIVDGMGTAGTEGVFRRCAEETLRVLRDGSEVIMTVLEVFKHDPLHSWTANEFKFNRVQSLPQQQQSKPSRRSPAALTGADTELAINPNVIEIDMFSDSVEESADRALSAVKRKLDKNMSVEYTVNELIAEATDEFNLARMYSGWAPHL